MNKQISQNTNTLMQHISENLLNLGFTTKLKGFVYANEAIYIYLNSSLIDYNFKEVLSSIAQKHSIIPAYLWSLFPFFERGCITALCDNRNCAWSHTLFSIIGSQKFSCLNCSSGGIIVFVFLILLVTVLWFTITPIYNSFVSIRFTDVCTHKYLFDISGRQSAILRRW